MSKLYSIALLANSLNNSIPSIDDGSANIKTYGSNDVVYHSVTRWKQQNRYKAEIGRNEKCYCGSNKKYKHCCLSRDELQNKKLSCLEGYTPFSIKASIGNALKIDNLNKIRLFGSRIFGNYNKESDLDVALLNVPYTDEMKGLLENKDLSIGCMKIELHWFEELDLSDVQKISYLKNSI